ncbi:MAG: DUF2141 domain-containing protein [Spirochaetaceae bacterium]|nr:DUF2141 domain-containing protein [Spirochaetaceae bacterium]
MDETVTIELANIREASGKVYVAVYDSAAAYKEDRPFRSYILEATGPILRIGDGLPAGEYVVSAFQDLNGNGKLDLNFLGIPKEPIGLSNYDGMGVPGGFDRLKIRISGREKTVRIMMKKLF